VSFDDFRTPKEFVAQGVERGSGRRDGLFIATPAGVGLDELVRYDPYRQLMSDGDNAGVDRSG